jgi:hypothetical protein
MIISKSVPMQISRKKFSEFLADSDTTNMYFVGYKDGSEGKKNA